MRLDDINAFIDVKRAHDRMAKRAKVFHDEDVQILNMSDFREIATLTDSSIKRDPMSDGSGDAIFSINYRSTKFWYMSRSGEVA